MKRVIISAVLLVVILGWSAAGSYTVNRVTKSLRDDIRYIQNIYESGNTERALILSNDLNKKWKGYELILSLMVHDDKISSLNFSMARITPLISNENDELIAEIQSIYHQLERIRQSELPYWYNIF